VELVPFGSAAAAAICFFQPPISSHYRTLKPDSFNLMRRLLNLSMNHKKVFNAQIIDLAQLEKKIMLYDDTVIISEYLASSFYKTKKKKKKTQPIKSSFKWYFVGVLYIMRFGRGNTITTNEIRTESLYQVVQQLDVLYRDAMYERAKE
jgi:hypothetical protein